MKVSLCYSLTALNFKQPPRKLTRYILGQSNLLRIQVEENPDLLLTVDTVTFLAPLDYSSPRRPLTQLSP